MSDTVAAGAVGGPPFVVRFTKCFLLVTVVMIVPAILIGVVVGSVAALAFPFG